MPAIISFTVLVYRSLAGTTPVYLDDECTLVTATGRCPLLGQEITQPIR